jgi:hypothetical protein
MFQVDKYQQHMHHLNQYYVEVQYERLELVVYQLDYVIANKFQHIVLSLLHLMDDLWKLNHHWD